MRAGALLFAVAGLGLAATPASAITKCVDPKGKVSYTDGKCPDDNKANELKLQVSPPSVDPALATRAPFDPATDDKDDPRMAEFVATQAGYEGCTNLAPDFGSRNGPAFDAWRAGRPDLTARLERSKRWQDALESARAQNKTQLAAPGGAQKMAAYCTGSLVPSLQKAPAR